MEFYRLYSQTNDENAVYDPDEYKTFSDAEIVLRKMIAEQGEKMNVAAYISAIRKGKNRTYRKIIADSLKNIFSKTEPLSVEKTKYTHAVVEKIRKGIHSHAKQIAWFCWDEERKGFYETEKPEWAGCWCNFALG